jgi:hypothetical protein
MTKGRAHIHLIVDIKSETDDLDAAVDEAVKKLEEAGYKGVELEEVEEGDDAGTDEDEDDEDGDDTSETPED